VNTSFETLTAERSTLAADVLRASGRLCLQVRGESMLPILWPRDVVEIARCSIADARPGDIVLALRGGRFFLHRFLARCGGPIRNFPTRPCSAAWKPAKTDARTNGLPTKGIPLQTALANSLLLSIQCFHCVLGLGLSEGCSVIADPRAVWR
jgi:hypothetical protein